MNIFESVNAAKTAYTTQKFNAQVRGIAFLLTFQEWCTWWGADIERRGTGPGDLQMQRKNDTGPYALGNIRKGSPGHNAVTRGNVVSIHNSGRSAAQVQIALDNLMNDPAAAEYDPGYGLELVR